MLFNSIEFCIFFILVTTVYFIIPHSIRWILLLLASCYFYMVFVPAYILILLVLIIIDYFTGIWIEDTQGPARKTYLIISILSTCLALFIFKYFNFFAANVDSVAKFFGLAYSIPFLQLILPIGLSFHTFQSLSYVIEVYKGRQKTERHFGIYALYVMFYPQLEAGPIERPQNLLHQFYEKHEFESTRVVSGLKLILWGFFKKLVIADRLALYVNAVYNNSSQHNGLTLSLATLFFAFQIYCDFSGYSDIAIGAARVMGFELMINFRRPYFARSVAEFWKRWHISLSTWFRDYLYIPLGGNQVSIPRWYLNLFIVFLVSGFWHGANWTYVIWGALHGSYLVSGLVVDRMNKNVFHFSLPIAWQRFAGYLNMIGVFLLVCFAWIFFRANNLHDAFLIINKIVHFHGPLFVPSLSEFIYSIIGILFLITAESCEEFLPGSSFFEDRRCWVRYAAYSAVILLILLIGVFDGGQFIYFQF